ncbi:MAG: single-stranded-DNA-specific exonuclease RecJ [Hydrotalea sp.]|nr:single-stranded-DNA-specific exonuclease RecJ [Hydrotalea sp.]
MKKNWIIQKANPEKVQQLQKALGISKIVCELLVQRGYENYENSKKFFRPSLGDLHDPWLMKDMQLAVDRIEKALLNHEKILIFGDYDVDGTTSVATLFSFLKNLQAQVDYYVPNRFKEGYGISKKGIDWAIEQKINLIISVDCGIKSNDLIQYAKHAGIDFIVCDHHLPDEVIPPAIAILNPKQTDCPYPFKELCGCGVVFKLIHAITNQKKLHEETYLQYIDLVATAIAADIVSMSGENRVICHFGIQKVNTKPNLGIQSLIELAGVKQPMTVSSLVFMIAPRVNAAGRMDDARKAIQLFIETDPTKAKEIAALLQSDNTDRREADQSITQEALEQLLNDPQTPSKKSTVVFQPHWHKGVVGIVASRLIEHHYKPTIVLTQSGDIVAGSARSIPGFNVYEAIHACKDWLIGYGGHFAAAGMTLQINHVQQFADAFEKAVQKMLPDELLTPTVQIDTEISFEQIQFGLYNIIQQMEPFGPDNLKPVFVAIGVEDKGLSKIVKENHIRFVLEQNNVKLTGIGFNMADKFSIIEQHKKIDVAFTMEENEWNGNKSLQLRVIDIRSN